MEKEGRVRKGHCEKEHVAGLGKEPVCRAVESEHQLHARFGIKCLQLFALYSDE